jgi:hypothetical protein
MGVLALNRDETALAKQSVRTTPASILLVAVWIGLTAGFLDLGLMILKKPATRFTVLVTISGGLFQPEWRSS